MQNLGRAQGSCRNDDTFSRDLKELVLQFFTLTLGRPCRFVAGFPSAQAAPLQRRNSGHLPMAIGSFLNSQGGSPADQARAMAFSDGQIVGGECSLGSDIAA